MKIQHKPYTRREIVNPHQMRDGEVGTIIYRLFFGEKRKEHVGRRVRKVVTPTGNAELHSLCGNFVWKEYHQIFGPNYKEMLIELDK